MIYSMTAFARTQNQGDWGSLTCEVRSINHRFLEIGLHVPEFIRAMEMQLRDIIRKNVKRGKIETSIRYQSAGTNNGNYKINTVLAQELCQASEKIASFVKKPAPINPTEILRYPGVLESNELDLVKMQPYVFDTLENTLAELVAMRGREGEELKQIFLQRMDNLEQLLLRVQERLPTVLSEQNERLRKRFADVKLELDSNRLEQEMVVFSQRVDVTEEIERTQTHINEIRRTLKQGGVIGRRLDFLMQELNREANTLGSKSVDSVVTHAAVEMKVVIEQVREQVQNVE